MTLGEKIRAQRKMLHLTQAELAEKVGVSRRVIISYEMNKTKPRTETGLLELARALNVNFDYLSRDSSKPTQESSDFSKLLDELVDEFSSLRAENKYSLDELNRWQRIFQHLLKNCLNLSSDDRIKIRACLCNTFFFVGNYPAAKYECESTLEEYNRLKPIMSEFILSATSFYSAEHNFANQLKIDDIRDDLFLLVQLLSSSTSISIRLGDYKIARERIQDANSILKLIISYTHSDEPAQRKADEQHIVLYSKMASLCRKTNEFERGKKYAEKAIELRLRFDNPGEILLDPKIDYQSLRQTSELAVYFSDLGYVFLGEAIERSDERQIYNLEQAIKNFQKGLDIRTRISINHPLLARSYHNIGRAYLELLQLVSPDDKNYSMYKMNAEKNINEALKIKKSDVYPNEDSLALEYKNLGLFFKYTGKLEKNTKNLEQSKYYFGMWLKSREDIYPEEHANIIDVKNQLAEVDKLISSIKDGEKFSDTDI